MTDFEPGMALGRGARGEFGLRNGEIEPGESSGEALGLKNGDFEPTKALEWGAEGQFGLRNANIDPVRPS